MTNCTQGHCFVDIGFKRSLYHSFKLFALANLCAEVPLDHDFLKSRGKIEPPLSLRHILDSKIELPFLFANVLLYVIGCICELVVEVTRYSVYSAMDLQSANYEIPVKDNERHLTVFKACGMLRQFRHIPHRVTDGVAYFKRIIGKTINEKLSRIFARIDNITICGIIKVYHDKSMSAFLSVATKYGFTFNSYKSTVAVMNFR